MIQWDLMKRRRTLNNRQHAVHWLPVDSRLISPLFSFGHIHGIAKIFIMVEMLLATAIVIGTFAMCIVRILT